MQIKVRWASSFAPENISRTTVFDVCEDDFEDSFNDLIDQWYSYCWQNNITSAKIVYVKTV